MMMKFLQVNQIEFQCIYSQKWNVLTLGVWQTKAITAWLSRCLSLNNFAAHGSGWTLDEIENTDVRLVKNNTIIASSYLALLRTLSGMLAMLNIQNREDEHCFFYCYAAAYHLKYGPLLVPVGSSSRRITSPVT